MPMPSSVKAITIVFSRPMWSEIQPNSGREMPFMMRSSISASGSAAITKKCRSTWKFLDAEILRDHAELGHRHHAAGDDAG